MLGHHQAPVVQTLDSAILWINHYPLDNSIGFASVYPLDSNLSGGQRYPSFEQLGPGADSGSAVAPVLVVVALPKAWLVAVQTLAQTASLSLVVLSC